MKSTRSLYHGHQYPREIISHAVWLYYRLGVSLRDVEDVLAKRGVGGEFLSVARSIDSSSLVIPKVMA